MFHLVTMKSNGWLLHRREEPPKRRILRRSSRGGCETLNENEQNDLAPALLISSRGLRFWKRRRRNKIMEEDAQERNGVEDDLISKKPLINNVLVKETRNISDETKIRDSTMGSMEVFKSLIWLYCTATRVWFLFFTNVSQLLKLTKMSNILTQFYFP